MFSRLRYLALCAGLVATTLVPSLDAGALSASHSFSVSSTVARSVSATMPVLRLHFNAKVSARRLPALRTSPAIATVWQQIGPRDVQAMIIGSIDPFVNYTIEVPGSLACAKRCTFTALRSMDTSVAGDITWEDQLLAELNYLPVTFSPATVQSDPSQPTAGTFTWTYPNLPNALSAQWSVGTPNIVVRGALMAFQNDNQLPTTGVADPATWNALVNAARTGKVDPNPYNYVKVSQASPETLTLYIAGQATFHTLVNTGISVAPTPQGTFPVYLRYTSQTMSGTNPDGSHYSDPGIPWISYFNGGAALHGFIRSTYGWPQSLGCVEMPFASAKTVWPHTPIGTLVTVQ